VGITLLFLAVYALILRPVKKQALAAFQQIPEHLKRAAKGSSATGGRYLEEEDLPPGSDDAKRAAHLKKQLAEKVKTEPAEASRLVQGWVRE
jgi:flagellar biosynthesis/type III secretory pathway M-ring protein FliF/YscJ